MCWPLRVFVGSSCLTFGMYASLDPLRSLSGEMDETDAGRSKRCNDDSISLAPSIAESIIVEGNVQFLSSSYVNMVTMLPL